MKIGIGGGIGPFRAGISTRGFGVGVGPLHASSGWGGRRRRGGGSSAGGCGTLIAVLLVVGGIYLLVAWPYLLGTWIAVQLGAGLHSTARAATGWVFEVVAVAVTIAVLVVAAGRSSARRAHQERLARVEEAQALRDRLYAQLGELEATLTALTEHPLGQVDGRVKPKEKLLATFPGVELLEPRSAYRSGPRIQTGVDTGTVLVTDLALRFLGTAKQVEWRYDRMIDRRAEVGGFIFSVTNRQLVSGVRVVPASRPALGTAIDWAAALADGAGVARAQAGAWAVLDTLQQALRTAEADLAARARELESA